jgi:hypothetical protein
MRFLKYRLKRGRSASHLPALEAYTRRRRRRRRSPHMGKQCDICPQPVVSNVKFHFCISPEGDERNITHFLRRRRRRGEQQQQEEEEEEEEEEEKSLRQRFSEHFLPPSFCRNFILVRARRRSWVYTLFAKSGHVNVSGVRDFSAIPAAVRLFNHVFSTRVDWQNAVSVDNSTSTGALCCCVPDTVVCLHNDHNKFRRQEGGERGRRRGEGKILRRKQQHQKNKSPGTLSSLNLHKVQKYLQLCTEDIHLTLRPYFFPGAVIRFSGPTAPAATAILFATRKYIIVGARSWSDILESQRKLCQIAGQRLSTTTAC